MSKLLAWATVLAAAVLVALASLGWGAAPHSPSQTDGSSILHPNVADAATAPAPVHGVIDENPPSPTPTLPPTSIAGPIARTATVRIGAYNDASVVSSGLWSPDQNLGGWTQLSVGPRQGGTFRSYVRFILAGLPSGMQIDNALLMLTPVGGGTQPVSVEADVIQDNWDEKTITWNLQPLSTYRAGAVSWQPGGSNQLSMDITQVAEQWYACGGTSNNGLELSADLSKSWVDFGSRKSDTPPVLQVTYEPAAAAANCAAPPSLNVNLSPPQAAGPSTTGAQIGSVNPNDIVNPAAVVGTPFGRTGIPVAPNTSGSGNSGIGTNNGTSSVNNTGTTSTTGTGTTPSTTGTGTSSTTTGP